MRTRRLVAVAGVAVLALLPAAALTSGANDSTPTLVQQVRDATRPFRDVSAATAAGYASLGSCVSGPEEGAMGIHYANQKFLDNPEVRADQPELLIYEKRGGRLRLLGVEFLVIADAVPAPPVLVGQHFQFVNSPNRYGLPAFYELHVWAWRENPKGVFTDWNPTVSCEEYTGEPGAVHTSH